jgi:RNAse (barnase) inhibitor barstar
MSGMREATIEAEFYRILKNLISEGQTHFPNMEFTKVKPQYFVDGGYADLVVFAKEDGIEKPFFVIETKRKTKEGTEYRFDPYSPKVIDQAAFYAMKIGAEYFATTNGEILVSFQTFKTGVPLPERRVKPYKIQMKITNEVVKSILEDLTKLHSGVEKWFPLDDVFVDRLQYFHSFIQPHVKRSLDYELLDLGFKKRYEDWVKSQFFEVSENTNEQMASQAAYLLMNRILFYKTLETQRADLPRLHKIDYTSGGHFTVKLRKYFKKALAIDYQAIFEERILNKIPVSNLLADVLNEFIEELDTYNLSKIRSDILGRVYENLIPEDERHRLGQYYTPPPIVELITEI